MDKKNKNDSSGGNPEEQEEVVTEETQEEETSALDEVLKDPELKAEYDARIQEAVAAALAEQDGEKAEELHPEEEETEEDPPVDNQREFDLEAREKSLLARELKAAAIEELAKEQLPAALADCFNYENEESYKLTKE